MRVMRVMRKNEVAHETQRKDKEPQTAALVGIWWPIPDSNRGPADYDSVALTG